MWDSSCNCSFRCRRLDVQCFTSIVYHLFGVKSDGNSPVMLWPALCAMAPLRSVVSLCFNHGACLCFLITRTSVASTRCLRWNLHDAVAISQARGFGHDAFSFSSQSLCLCKNSSEPFTPRLLPAGRIKTHTHSLGTGPGPWPAQSRDKEIGAQRQEAWLQNTDPLPQGSHLFALSWNTGEYKCACLIFTM